MGGPAAVAGCIMVGVPGGWCWSDLCWGMLGTKDRRWESKSKPGQKKQKDQMDDLFQILHTEKAETLDQTQPSEAKTTIILKLICMCFI